MHSRGVWVGTLVLGGLSLYCRAPAGDAIAPRPTTGAPTAVADAVVDLVAVAGTGIDLRIVNGDPEKPYIVDAMGTGVCLFDFDGDGRLDVFVVNGSTLEEYRRGRGASSGLYRNLGNWKFEDATASAGVSGRGWGQGCAVGDVNSDGHTDLYVTALGPNLLYRNRGDSTFVEVGVSSGVADPRWSTSAVFADVDGDGQLDLYVANYVRFDLEQPPPPHAGSRYYNRLVKVFAGPQGLTPAADALYRGRGDGSFVDATAFSGILTENAAFGLGVIAADLDHDGDVDFYVANDSQPNFLFRNRGNGQFDEVGVGSGAALSAEGRAQAGMGLAAGDVDEDGLLDLFVTNFSEDYNTLYLAEGNGAYSDRSESFGLASASFHALGWATHLVDVDNDGDLDLFVANGHVYPQVDGVTREQSYRQRNQLFRSTSKSFMDCTNCGAGLELLGASRGAASGDLDDDGRIDFVVVNIDGGVDVLRNETRNAGHWLGLDVRTAGGQLAHGARVVVAYGDRRHSTQVGMATSYLSASDARLLVGLGAADRAEEVRVRWLDGHEERFESLTADSYYRIAPGAAARYAPPETIVTVPQRDDGPRAAVVSTTPAGVIALPPGLTLAERFRRGEESLRLGRYRDAIGWFESVVLEQPNHAVARLHFGTAAFRAGRLDIAREQLSHAVELEPGSLAAQLQLAELCVNLQDLVGGERAARAALAIDRSSAAASYLLGTTLAAGHSLEEAVAAFDDALVNAERKAAILHKKGMVLAKLKRAPEAEAAFAAALRAEPGLLGARYGLHQLRSRRGEVDAAEERALRLQSEVAGELSHLESRVHTSPDALAERRQLALLYEGAGRDHDALRELTEVLRRVPTDLEGLIAYARIAARHGRMADAHKLLEVATLNYPKSERPWLERGRLDLAAGAGERALHAVRRAVALAPESRGAAEALARVLAAVGTGDESLAAARRAAALGSRDVLLLGRALARAGASTELRELVAREAPLASGAERREMDALIAPNQP